MQYTKGMVLNLNCKSKITQRVIQNIKENYLFYATILISILALNIDFLIIKQFIKIISTINI